MAGVNTVTQEVPPSELAKAGGIEPKMGLDEALAMARKPRAVMCPGCEMTVVPIQSRVMVVRFGLCPECLKKQEMP